MRTDTCEESGLKHLGVRSLLGNTLVYGGGDALSKLASLVLLPALTFRLSPEQMGVSSLLLMWYSLAGAVFGLGIGASLGPVYFAAKTDADRLRAMWTAVCLMAVSSALLIGLVTLENRRVNETLFGHETTFNNLLILSSVSAALNMAAGPFRLRLQFEGAPLRYVLAGLLATFSTAAATLIAVFALHLGVFGVVAGNIAGQLVLLASAMLLVGSYRPACSLALAKDQLRIGLPLVPSFCVIFLLSQSGRYITNTVAGLAAVGIYTTATNLGLGLSVAVTALQAAWYPFFMQFMEKAEEAKPLFARVFKYYVYVYGALNLLFYLFAKPLVQLAISKQYAAAVYGVGITASAEFVRGAAILLLPPVYFARRLYVVTIIQIAAALVAITIGLAAVRRAGWLGVSASMLVANLVMVVLHYNWNSYIYRFVVPYEFGKIFRVVTVYTVSAVVLVLAYDMTLGPYVAVSTALVIVTMCAIYTTLENSERTRIEVGAQRKVAVIRAAILSWLPDKTTPTPSPGPPD